MAMEKRGRNILTHGELVICCDCGESSEDCECYKYECGICKDSGEICDSFQDDDGHEYEEYRSCKNPIHDDPNEGLWYP